MLHCHLYLNATPVAGGGEVFQPGKSSNFRSFYGGTKKEEAPLSARDTESTQSIEQEKLLERELRKDAFLKG